MKKFTFLLIIGLVLSVPGMALALTNSGMYMFTQNGNDPSSDSADLSTLQGLVDGWFASYNSLNSTSYEYDLDFYAKVDSPAGATTEGTGVMVVTYEQDFMSGTWATDDDIHFYTVKAGQQYALYWVEGGSTSGTWSTEDLEVGGQSNQPSISHLSTYDATVGTAPTPEPSTLALLGFGLLGFAAWRRRR